MRLQVLQWYLDNLLSMHQTHQNAVKDKDRAQTKHKNAIASLEKSQKALKRQTKVEHGAHNKLRRNSSERKVLKSSIKGSSGEQSELQLQRVDSNLQQSDYNAKKQARLKKELERKETLAQAELDMTELELERAEADLKRLTKESGSKFPSGLELLNFFIRLKSERLSRYMEMAEGCGTASLKMRSHLHELLVSPEPDIRNEDKAEQWLRQGDPEDITPMHPGCDKKIQHWIQHERRLPFLNGIFNPYLRLIKVFERIVKDSKMLR